jgi:hypothetical protein
MAFCEFRYPDEITPTASFVATHAPISPGSNVGYLPGIATDVMSDGVTVYRYQIADPNYDFELKFAVLDDTDVSNLVTFLGNVGGEMFRMKAPITLGTWYDVALSEETYHRIELRSFAPGMWEATLKLRRIVGS